MNALAALWRRLVAPAPTPQPTTLRLRCHRCRRLFNLTDVFVEGHRYIAACSHCHAPNAYTVPPLEHAL